GVDERAILLLGHLVREEPFAVGALVGGVTDHALGEEAREWLLEIEIAALGERARKEAGIEQMQHRVLDAADVLVDRHPVVDVLALERILGARRAEAQEIPGRLEEGVEGVGLAPRGLAATGARDVLPGRVMVERIAGLVE